MKAEIEKQLYADLAEAYLQGSVTKADRAISEAYKKASDAIIIDTPEPEPEPEPPTPVTGWPKPEAQWPYAPVNPTALGFLTVGTANAKYENFTASGVYQKDTTGLRIATGKIDGKGTGENGIQFSDYTAHGIEVTGTKDGMKAHGSTFIDSCWIHDLRVGAGIHADGIQISGGENITIKNTRFGGNTEQNANAGIFIKPEGNGNIKNVVIDGCYFDRFGNFAIYTQTHPTYKTYVDTLTVRNCIFGKTVSYVDWAKTHNLVGAKNIVWENNIDIYGKPVLLEQPRRIS